MAEALVVGGMFTAAVMADAFEVMKATKTVGNLRNGFEVLEEFCQHSYVTLGIGDQFSYPEQIREDEELNIVHCLPEDEELKIGHGLPENKERLRAIKDIRCVPCKRWNRINRWKCNHQSMSEPMKGTSLLSERLRPVDGGHDHERCAFETPYNERATVGEESFDLELLHHTCSDGHEAVKDLFETGSTMKKDHDLVRSSTANGCTASTGLASRDRRCFDLNCNPEFRFGMLDSSCLLVTKIMIPPLQWLFLHSLQLEPYSLMDQRILRAMPLVRNLIDVLKTHCKVSWILLFLATTLGTVALSRPILSALRNPSHAGGRHTYMVVSSILAMVFTALYWAYESGSALDFFVIGMPFSVSVGISLSFLLRFTGDKWLGRSGDIED